MPKDLRSFLKERRSSHPQDFLDVDRPISAAYEVTALQRKLGDMGKFPIMMIDKPVRADGQPSDYRLITNLLASRAVCADAVGVHPRRVAMEYTERQNSRGELLTVQRGDAPVKQVVECDDDCNVLKFPIPIHHAMDIGPYITIGFCVTMEPESRIQNSAIQRIWAKSPRRLGYNPDKRSHGMFDIQKWWNMGKPAPVAVWIGHHPAAMIGSQSKLGYPESHWPSMSGLLGEPLRLVPSETLGEDFLVPADAEIVIEGWVPPGVWEAEAPFADYHSYTVPQKMGPVIDVTAVTHRQDAIYHTCLAGAADNLVMGNFPVEARVYQSVKPLIPEVTNVHIPISGRRFHAHVQVKNERPYLIGKDVIMATLPCDPRIKTVFVVDEDIDIFDEQQVWWAIATRSRWDTDLLVVPSPPNYLLLGTRGGIDATLPPLVAPGLPHYFHPVNLMPDEVMARINVLDYANKDQLAEFGGTY